MGIKQKDIKLLWGRAGNRCSICKEELTQDKGAYTLGEQAHIVGEKPDAARGESNLSLDERNSYPNLILLCPNHHRKIDSNEDEWTVEKLHHVKSEHEIWVADRLSEADQSKIAKKQAIKSIIDAAVDLCKLETWRQWTNFSPEPTWPSDLPNNIFDFRQKVLANVWPDEFEELKRAAITFSFLLNQAAQKFMEHSELHRDTYFPNKFYKADECNENYHKDIERYLQWIELCRSNIYEATKAANWFADVVRRDIDPMFFAEAGKFIIIEGDAMGFEPKLMEFTKEERDALPDALSGISAGSKNAV